MRRAAVFAAPTVSADRPADEAAEKKETTKNRVELLLCGKYIYDT